MIFISYWEYPKKFIVISLSLNLILLLSKSINLLIAQKLKKQQDYMIKITFLLY